MRIILSILLLSKLTITYASTYEIGDIVSEADQNITKSTCYAGNGYEVDDEWKLADWNGATNGGHYNVLFIDMSASW